mmetsp:Transcript_1822/g.2586  ORF Transcript_1822/g.2586 Transcript_1822/m.2586 type:complete len:92 (+) Transcript_1822:461-736(+)
MLFSNANKQHAKLVRNVEKFEKAEHFFNASTQEMSEKINDLIKKLDQLSIFLNVKFFQNITLSFYKQQDDMFRKMHNLPSEIDDLKYRMET